MEHFMGMDLGSTDGKITFNFKGIITEVESNEKAIFDYLDSIDVGYSDDDVLEHIRAGNLEIWRKTK